MDTDVPPGRRDRRDPADRMALRCVFSEEISNGQFDLIRALFHLLRADTFSRSDDSLSRRARFHRRRTYSPLLRRHPHVPSAVETTCGDRLFGCPSGTGSAVGSLLHVRGQRPVFGKHARHRRHRFHGSSRSVFFLHKAIVSWCWAACCSRAQLLCSL